MNRLILSLVFLFAMNGLWINADAAGNQNGNSAPQGGYAYMGDKVTKTDAEWKKVLTPEQYDVLRHEGTERAFRDGAVSPFHSFTRVPLHEHQKGARTSWKSRRSRSGKITV